VVKCSEFEAIRDRNDFKRVMEAKGIFGIAFPARIDQPILRTAQVTFKYAEGPVEELRRERQVNQHIERV
jgi:hypothetical protein